MTPTQLTSFGGKFGLAHVLGHLTQAGFPVLGEGSDAFLAAAVFGVELFVPAPGPFVPVSPLPLPLALLLLPDDLILGRAAPAGTCLTAFISNGLFSLGPGNDTNTTLVGALKMDARGATVLVVKFLGLRLRVRVGVGVLRRTVLERGLRVVCWGGRLLAGVHLILFQLFDKKII